MSKSIYAPPLGLKYGKNVKVKDLDLTVKLFSVSASTSKTAYILTNNLGELTSEQVQKNSNIVGILKSCTENSNS
jgi:hypothetical protein